MGLLILEGVTGNISNCHYLTNLQKNFPRHRMCVDEQVSVWSKRLLSLLHPDAHVREDPRDGGNEVRAVPGRALPLQLRDAQELPGASQDLLGPHRTQEAGAVRRSAAHEDGSGQGKADTFPSAPLSLSCLTPALVCPCSC